MILKTIWRELVTWVLAKEDVQAQMPDALSAQADVTDERQMQAFFDQVTAAYGGLDVLVSNAGIGGPAGSIETLNLKDWRRCLSVNLDGAFWACGWAAELMRANLLHGS